MDIIREIEPKKVMYWFSEISKIPHGSGNTKKIADYCENFAKERDLTYFRDELNNIIIIKSASGGYENSEPVILQGHLDMVCEKSKDAEIDMQADGLTLCVDRDYIYAKDTTLGADDGIAIAMILAILDSDCIEHPKIEAVFTVDEEIGMLGADYIDLSMLSAKRLINIDSEIEGIFTVSCAGGNVTECVLPIKREKVSGNLIEIEISDLVGGHSGIEIDKGRANACKLLGKVLEKVSENTKLKIESVSGGTKDNAIPTSAKARIICENDFIIEDIIKEVEEKLKKDYLNIETNIKISYKKYEYDNITAINAEDSKKLINLLQDLPNGVISVSKDIEGLVETSLNLGILKTFKDYISASFCVRSSVAKEKEELVSRLNKITTSLGGCIKVSGDYPAWEYKQNSELRDLMERIFILQYENKPKIEAVHAGLECGLFCGKIDGLDCVSIGPNLLDIHTTKERMSISSVQRTWAFLLEVLKQMK